MWGARNVHSRAMGWVASGVVSVILNLGNVNFNKIKSFYTA